MCRGKRPRLPDEENNINLKKYIIQEEEGMKAIDNKELVLALEELENEKGKKKSYLIEAIEQA